MYLLYLEGTWLLNESCVCECHYEIMDVFPTLGYSADYFYVILILNKWYELALLYLLSST